MPMHAAVRFARKSATRTIEKKRELPVDCTDEALTAFVRRTARRMICRIPAGSRVTYDDLHSAGLLALVEASRRFDPSRGIAFPLFAYRRIQGAMLDELRSLDTVSRERRRAIRNGKDKRNAPPPPRLVELNAASAVPDPMPDVEERVAARLSIARLTEARRRLPERLRLVLHLRMEADWTLRQIAERLGVTQGRVCQLVGEGVKRLRAEMSGERDDRGVAG